MLLVLYSSATLYSNDTPQQVCWGLGYADGQAGADGWVIWITGWEGRENDVRSRAMGRASGREGGVWI